MTPLGVIVTQGGGEHDALTASDDWKCNHREMLLGGNVCALSVSQQQSKTLAISWPKYDVKVTRWLQRIEPPFEWTSNLTSLRPAENPGYARFPVEIHLAFPVRARLSFW